MAKLSSITRARVQNQLNLLLNNSAWLTILMYIYEYFRGGNQMKARLYFLNILLLCGCTTSGVVQTGPDSFMARAHSTPRLSHKNVIDIWHNIATLTTALLVSEK